MHDEKFKLKKIDELVALRTSLIYVLIVLIGGTIGILLSANTPLKIILICLGVFYSCVLISNIGNITNKIDKIFLSEKEIK
jgi:hypothetical protein